MANCLGTLFRYLTICKILLLDTQLLQSNAQTLSKSLCPLQQYFTGCRPKVHHTTHEPLVHFILYTEQGQAKYILIHLRI